MENRRKLERYNMNLISFVEADRGEKENTKPLYMMTANICAGGAFLRTDASLTNDMHVHIGFFIPTQNPVNPESPEDKVMALVETSGTVIRCDEMGVAIQFDKEYIISPLVIKRRREG